MLCALDLIFLNENLKPECLNSFFTGPFTLKITDFKDFSTKKLAYIVIVLLINWDCNGLESVSCTKSLASVVWVMYSHIKLDY